MSVILIGSSQNVSLLTNQITSYILNIFYLSLSKKVVSRKHFTIKDHKFLNERNYYILIQHFIITIRTYRIMVIVWTTILNEQRSSTLARIVANACMMMNLASTPNTWRTWSMRKIIERSIRTTAITTTTTITMTMTVMTTITTNFVHE